MLSYYMYLVFSQVLCLIQIFYQILPKQNSIRGQTIRQSDWCGDTISSKRSCFSTLKLIWLPFERERRPKFLVALVSATQLPGWHSLPATNRNTQNASCKTQVLRSAIPLKLPLPSDPSWTDHQLQHEDVSSAALHLFWSHCHRIRSAFYIYQKVPEWYKLIVGQVTSGSPSILTPFPGDPAPPLRRPRRTAPRGNPAWRTSGGLYCSYYDSRRYLWCKTKNMIARTNN